jgi:subtilisin
MQTRRYVVLPAFGFKSPALAQSAKLRTPGPFVRLSARPAIRQAAERFRSAADTDAATKMHVLDSISEDGPKLVEMSPEAELNLRAEIPGLKVVPVVTYHTMRAAQGVNRPAAAQAATGIKLTVVSALMRAGVMGAKVVAFTDFRTRAGAEGFTNEEGSVSLNIQAGSNLDRLYVYGPAGHWGHFSGSQRAEAEMRITIEPIDLAAESLLLRQQYGKLPDNAGKGIKVGIIDTGIAMRHPALPNVTGGANMVFDEIRDNADASGGWGPAATEGEHGTHVAGIVGARPTAALNLRGVAPGVELRSYRVFPNAGGGAQNFDILSAINRAVQDGCHIVNLSLGGGSEDEAVRVAIGAALDAGTLVVAAAGNDYRKAVSFPAALESCVAVSAMGTAGTFPKGSVETAEVAKPYGSDTRNFIAAFSNFGPQIDLTGPGVGIVSALPDDTYGVMSGTSMACPAVVGYAAHLLATNPDIKAAKGSERSKLWKNLLDGRGVPLGFPRDYEGFGLPSDPLTS